MLVGRRSGISEVIASVIMIALTVVVGAGVWGFVNLQAGTSEKSFNSHVNTALNQLNERFEVVMMGYTSTTATIYIFNAGPNTLYVSSIDIYNSTNAVNVQWGASGSVNELSTGCTGTAAATESPVLGTGAGAFSVSSQTMKSVVLTLPSCVSWTFNTDHTYLLKAVGSNGFETTYFQER